MKRYAIVWAADSRRQVEQYLPDNYSVIHEEEGWQQIDGRVRKVQIIGGEDVAGWTLDAYVIPRLASGLIQCEEIDLSHPIMKRVPA